ncbi:MAG: DUF2071 domain-containing protein [Tepidisphaeraceae bacterium]
MKFSMRGRLSDCLLLAYRVPAEGVRHLLPAPLEPVTRGRWAFWNLVACRVEAMRPRGTPRSLGLTYCHVAYRLYVRARTTSGKSIDGLYFVRSDCDHPSVTRLGELFTDFRFHTAKIAVGAARDGYGADVTASRYGAAEAHVRAVDADHFHLQPDSCFDTVEQAAALLKYRPVAMSVDEDDPRHVKLAEVIRDESRWHETPLRVTSQNWGFFEYAGQEGARLEWATRVDPLEYRWRLGRRAKVAATELPELAVAH